jgi:hypothetical protein
MLVVLAAALLMVELVVLAIVPINHLPEVTAHLLLRIKDLMAAMVAPELILAVAVVELLLLVLLVGILQQVTVVMGKRQLSQALQ